MYLKVDLDVRCGDNFYAIEKAMEKIMNPYTPYGHFKTNRDKSLRFILKLIYSADKDALEIIYDLKVNIAHFLAKDFLNQLGKKAV